MAVSKAERGRGAQRADGAGSWWQREGGGREAPGGGDPVHGTHSAHGHSRLGQVT
jgi:hypothetical protein